MSEESATPTAQAAPSAEFQAAFSALTAGKRIARESWEGKKRIVGIETLKPDKSRPPCLLVKVEGQAGVTPVPLTEPLAMATDWVVLP